MTSNPNDLFVGQKIFKMTITRLTDTHMQLLCDCGAVEQQKISERPKTMCKECRALNKEQLNIGNRSAGMEIRDYTADEQKMIEEFKHGKSK